MNLTERARLQSIRPRATYRWSQEDKLPVPPTRINARTVLIAPEVLLTSCCARRYGLRPARNRAQDTLRSAVRHVSPSRPAAT